MMGVLPTSAFYTTEKMRKQSNTGVAIITNLVTSVNDVVAVALLLRLFLFVFLLLFLSVMLMMLQSPTNR